MKKIIFSVAVALVVSGAALGGYAYHQQSQIDPMILENAEALTSAEAGSVHTLTCGSGTIKMCEATCGICQVTLKAWGNGSPVTLTCKR